jgi:hypothetical protein
MMRHCFLILLFFTMLAPQVAPGQTTVRYEPLLENRQVAVFRLELPPGQRAPIYQNTHDIFWIALDAASLTLIRNDGTSMSFDVSAGDTRFFSSFATKSINNTGDAPFRGVIVQVKTRGLTSAGCDCSGAAEKAICGCPGASRLPQLWAAGIGSVMAGGTTLLPGQGFEHSADRADTLLVALTPMRLADEAITRQVNIVLNRGEVKWIAAGPHKFKNMAEAPARYVTFEF